MKLVRWKWLWGIGLAGILLSLSFFWVSRPHKESPRPPEPAVTADLLTLSSREVPVLSEATGFVVPETQATLASRITALVEEIRVREGDRVQTGDPLIVLDSRDLRARLQRAARILPSADPASHSFTVKVDLAPQPGLAGGLFGRLLFTTGSRKPFCFPRRPFLRGTDCPTRLPLPGTEPCGSG